MPFCKFSDNKSLNDRESELNSILKLLDHREIHFQQKLNFEVSELEKAIVSVLKICPNKTCIKDSIPSLVLSYFRVITRGRIKERFKIKLIKIIDQLRDRQIIAEEYKDANLRIRLL